MTVKAASVIRMFRIEIPPEDRVQTLYLRSGEGLSGSRGAMRGTFRPSGEDGPRQLPRTGAGVVGTLNLSGLSCGADYTAAIVANLSFSVHLRVIVEGRPDLKC